MSDLMKKLSLFNENCYFYINSLHGIRIVFYQILISCLAMPAAQQPPIPMLPAMARIQQQVTPDHLRGQVVQAMTGNSSTSAPPSPVPLEPYTPLSVQQPTESLSHHQQSMQPSAAKDPTCHSKSSVGVQLLVSTSQVRGHVVTSLMLR